MPAGLGYVPPVPPTTAPKPLLNMRQVLPGDTITAVTAGAGAETMFASSKYVFDANTLKVGETYTCSGYGVFTVSMVGPTQRPRIRLGAALLVDAGAMGLLANVPGATYSFDCTFSVRAVGAAGVIEAGAGLVFQSMVGGSAAPFVFSNTVAVDTTVPQTFGLSTQYSAATSGNSNTLRQILMFRHPAA